jgi:sortase A
MRPEDRQLGSGNPRGNVQPPKRDTAAAQTAAADIARSQLDSIYSQTPAQPEQKQQAAQHNGLPATYKRTHEPAHTTQNAEWQQYHTAWQQYYQKYYEHYYVEAVQQVHQTYRERVAHVQPSTTLNDLPPPESDSLSEQEAIRDLRAQLLNKVRSSSGRFRKSRHFIPLSSAVVVLLLFGFLQYNRVIVANVQAYVTPGNIDPQNIVVDPNASLQVGPEPLLIIPKINVNVPIVWDTQPDNRSQMEAMEDGVAYFGIPGANSKPGQIGNTVISGHSSNDFIDGGSYKFVFALLDRLKDGDVFYIHYNGLRYTYSVSRTEVVKPTDVDALVYDTNKPIVTLITCTPLGTALNRLLVTAEQISPNPASASQAPSEVSTGQGTKMPGNSPTFVERIFGAQ